MKKMKVLLIGDGRLAGHLKYVMTAHSITWGLSWSLLSHDDLLSNPPSKLDDSARQSNVALLAVSDQAIDEVARSLPENLVKVHFSGACSTEHAIGIHPLMTFGEELFPLSFYERIPLIMDQKAAQLDWVRALPNPKHILPQEQKGLYHAICHLSGNFPKLLWEECFEVLERSTSLKREVFLPYLEQSLKQVLQRKTDLLSGPFGRGDHETVAKHQAQLAKAPLLNGLYSKFYDSFQERFPHESV